MIVQGPRRWTITGGGGLRFPGDTATFEERQTWTAAQREENQRMAETYAEDCIKDARMHVQAMENKRRAEAPWWRKVEAFIFGW